MGQVPMPANRIQPGLQICNASLKSYCANVQYFVQLQYKANVLCIFALCMCIVHKYAIYVQWSGPVNDCSSRTNRLHQPTIQSPKQSIQFQVFEYFWKHFVFQLSKFGPTTTRAGIVLPTRSYLLVIGLAYRASTLGTSVTWRVRSGSRKWQS